MIPPKDDLDKIGDVLLDFFETERIRNSLDLIHQFGGIRMGKVVADGACSVPRER